MIGSKFRKLFQKLRIGKEHKLKINKVKNFRKSKKEVQLPDNVLSKIFDYSSPYDVAKWRTVNRQFNRVVDNRNKDLLYLDVLRMDMHDILPLGATNDGDFFKHSSAQILIHTERRSVLLAVHSHWNVHDAVKLLRMIRYYGKFASTITLDASVAELCVAGQCTNDISHWFMFQTTAGSCDPQRGSDIMSPGWLPSSPRAQAAAIEKIPRWNPRTQRIPVGPLFPKAKEITFRASIPQLRRLRRLSVYKVQSKVIFDSQLQLFRLSITGCRRSAPVPLRLKPFLEWLDHESLGGKYCTQFC